MKKEVASYGQAGGRGQGQPYSRFQIQGDPTPAIPWWAAGSMVSNSPAHLMGDIGGAYYYGSTKVGGITNMTSNGDVLRPLIIPTTQVALDGPYSIYLGGVGFYDCIANSPSVSILSDGQDGDSRIDCNGEICRNPTTALVFGAAKETFTTAVTVTAANASQAIVFSASIAAAVLPGYAYTPNRNAPQVGDVVEIVQAGVHYFHRLVTGAAAAWTMYPAYQGAGGAGLVTNIHRTGFGSSSRALHFVSSAGVDFYYYVGNQINSTPGIALAQRGTIECVVGGLVHIMSPVTTPAAAQVIATDIAYYKSFLLYMSGGSISWSVAGFPTGGAAGFLTGDFPDLNTSVIDTQDTGVAFEFLGDQLIALFHNGAWLVQPTGIVPEFAFYRLPQIPGAFSPQGQPQGADSPSSPGYVSAARPVTRSAASVFFVSEQGLEVIQGAPPASSISLPVDNYDWPAATAPAQPLTFALSWDQASDTVLWRDHVDGRGLIFRKGMWAQLDLTAIAAVRGTTAADPVGVSGFVASKAYRQFGVQYWLPSDQKIYSVGQLDAETTLASKIPWIAASPIFNLGLIYGGFKFGGFEVWARGAVGAVAPVNLQWTVYGGYDPYHMVIRAGPTNYDYATGMIDGRSKIGPTLDDPYVGIVLTGSSWIELAGVMIYASDSEAV